MDRQSDARTAMFGQNLNVVLGGYRQRAARSEQFAKLGNGDA